MRLSREGHAYPRINPLMVGYQELPGEGFGRVFPYIRRNGWAGA